MQTRVRERRPRSKDGVRKRILDAARELFVKQGYENVSMRKVAENISYSPTTIYLYFRDKMDLFNCLCEEMYAKLSSLPDSLPQGDVDPLLFLRRVLRAYVDFGLASPNQYRVAFLLSSKTPMRPEDFLPTESKALQAYTTFRTAVQACVKERRFRKVNVDTASQALWAAVHGLTSLLILFPSFPWASHEQMIDLTIDSMIRGLMQDAATA